MKQKLLMLLAVLLTGGMLAACGPGDGTDGVDGVGGGGGVVDEPIEGGAVEDDAALNGDVAVGDDAALNGEVDAGAEADAAADADIVEGEPETEGEQIELDVGEESEVPLEGAEDQASAEVQQPADGEEVAGGAAPAEGEMVTITFTQAAEGVAVENIQGAQDGQSIAETGQTNPELTLSTGQRYQFMYDGEGDLVFYNANDEELLSTAGADSAFSQDGEVQAETGDGQLTFTLTDQLSQEIDRYTVGPEDQGGQVTVN